MCSGLQCFAHTVKWTYYVIYAVTVVGASMKQSHLTSNPCKQKAQDSGLLALCDVNKTGELCKYRSPSHMSFKPIDDGQTKI